jgi:hypothetical protein
VKPPNIAVIAVALALPVLASCTAPSARLGSPPSRVRAGQSPGTRAHHDRADHRRDRVNRRDHRHRAAVRSLARVHDPRLVTGTVNGPCHTRDHGLLPDQSCTPGAVDPAVTPANIHSTICRSGYTDSVRPPESQTDAFKWNIAEPAYGQHDVTGELDHLVPLELGGDNDARNLWVEAGPIPNAKDAVENALNDAVCAGQIKLRVAQREIARNWVKAAANLGISVPGPAESPPATGSAWCRARAAYSSRYSDWDVYVHSNQPDTTVTVSSGSYSHSWQTDSVGYADVYLRGPARGQTITVTVGAARCSATTA